MIFKETMVETTITYSLEFEGKFYLIENVPARVCLETGEKFFSPETVEKLQRIIWGDQNPDKVIETPVYQFN